MNCFEYCVPFAIMFFLHILILYHLLEEVIFTLYYLYTTTISTGKTDWNDKRYKEEKRDTERTFCAASKIRNQPPVIWIPYEAEETVKAGDRLLDKKGTFI